MPREGYVLYIPTWYIMNNVIALQRAFDPSGGKGWRLPIPAIEEAAQKKAVTSQK